jgi:hypothetical protein
MKTNRLLVAVLALQGLILLGQWTGAGAVAPAQAQIPNGADQRKEMVDELRTLNGKMDKLIDLLGGGKLQVQLAKPEEK